MDRELLRRAEWLVEGLDPAAQSQGPPEKEPLPEQDARGRELIAELRTEAYRTTILVIAVFCAIFILEAFVLRGSLSNLIVGISIVRPDGRPASRVRCASRALLFWLPVAGLLAASSACEAWRPELPALAWGLRSGAVFTVFLYAAIAMALPDRPIHDRLAGTALILR